MALNMRAHLVQLDIAWEDKEKNRARVRELLAAAATAPGDLIVLPEMYETGFSLNVERTADVDGAGAASLSRLATDLRAFVQGAVTSVGPDNRGRNRAIIHDPAGAEIARYDKIHPFSFGREPERFSGGDRIVTCAWRASADSALTICPAICYDLRFPELFRAGLTLGAEIFVIGANWPAERALHWRSLLIARAIENQAYVLGVNRAGDDPHLSYSGGSLAVDPQGAIIAEADSRERVLSIEVDPDQVRSWRSRFPAWRDGRSPLLPRLGPDGRLDAPEAPKAQ